MAMAAGAGTPAVPKSAPAVRPAPAKGAPSGPRPPHAPSAPRNVGAADYEAKKRADAEARKRDRERKALRNRIAELEGRISEREIEVKALETKMSAPGFYENREASKPVIDRHQALMWEVGDLMNQWEALQQVTSNASYFV